jgi:sulfate transport system substrate-binding protein
VQYDVELLNVSYDPTRELFKEYNDQFAQYWQKKSGEKVIIRQSHGGSGKQARSVLEGIRADVVTLGLGYDIDAIADNGMISTDWKSEFKYRSTPYYSTIVLLVRKGNPKNIKDWNDLLRSDVDIVTPNPKTSGGARWNYLAAYGYALNKFDGNKKLAVDFISEIYKNVKVLDTGARASTTTFVDRKIGDVLISWENEALMALNELGDDQFEIVNPSISISAEPPVAVVDRNVDKNKTRTIATEYLQYLYSEIAQETIAKHYFRPRSMEVQEKYRDSFPSIKMLSIEDFGGWRKVQKEHFSDEGIFDNIYSK